MAYRPENEKVSERAELLKYKAEKLEEKARAQNVRFTLLLVGMLGIAVVCMFIYS